jgi:hypothetical protein
VTGRPAAARPAGISQIITWCARLTAAGSRAGTAGAGTCPTARASLPERIAADAAAAAGRITTGKDQS